MALAARVLVAASSSLELVLIGGGVQYWHFDEQTWREEDTNEVRRGRAVGLARAWCAAQST